MIIPPRRENGETGDREALFRNTIRECQTSMEDRRLRYRRYHDYALAGSENGASRRNKVAEWLDASSSYCYAREFVKFAATLPRAHAEKWIEETDAARDVVEEVFVESKIDAAYEKMVKWAHVYPCMIGKVVVSERQPVLQVLADPSRLGAYDESVDDLDEQEALVHQFEMSTAAYTRLIRQSIPSEARADELISEGLNSKYRGSGRSQLLTATPRILDLAAASPNMIGAPAHSVYTDFAVTPRVDGEVVPMVELWVRDDFAYESCARCHRRQVKYDHHEQGPLRDHEFAPSGEFEWEWRKVLAAGELGDTILWSTLNPLLRQRHPFRMLRFDDTPGYLWGASPLDTLALIALQDWSEDLMAKHNRLLNLQLNPPIAIVGMSNVDGERAKLLREEGGTFSMPAGPGVEIKRLAPETPPDAAGTQQLINNSFNEAGGLPTGSQGAPEANVRSAGQMTAGAMLSSPRTTKRAMRVEDTLEEIMTDAIQLKRRESPEFMHIAEPEPDPEKQPEEFAKWKEKPYRSVLLSQIPGEIAVRVSAHSASPLFREQHKQDAIVLKREGAIDAETFVELYGSPMEDVVRPKTRRLMKAAAKVKERAIEIKEREAHAKEEKAARSK